MAKLDRAGRLSLLAALAISSGGCSVERDVVGSFSRPDAGAADVEPPWDGPDFGDVGACQKTCSIDGRKILDTCRDGVEVECGATETCLEGACVDACALAEESKASVGCDYWSVNMDVHIETVGACFVTMVTNTFGGPAHVSADFRGAPIDLSQHAAIPRGSGASVTYEPYDPEKGLAPGEVLVLFLAQSTGSAVPCPVPAARSTGAQLIGSGIGDAFHVASDVPVVAYQMMPYGGGSAAVTGATLLLPTSAWGTNYVATTAWPHGSGSLGPSMNLIAREDGTEIEVLPRVDIKGREGLFPGGKAGTTVKYSLGKGEVLQITQADDLAGSPISANKRIALFAGHPCMNVPADAGYCDHAEQQIPPVAALGHEYVGAPHRPRVPSDVKRKWRILGAVDGTTLTYDPPGLGPSAIGLGAAIEFETDGPFVVKSQDEKHPFQLFGYMTGSALFDGWGDPEFVRMTAPSQFLSRYVFLTDPSYPETNLVVVRKRTAAGFADVELACAGKLTGWKPVGTSGEYEITTIDLVSHDFAPQGECDNGVQTMSSNGTFGVWVWGWGGPETTGGSCGPFTPPNPKFTCAVSYAYPAGESVRPINDVVVPARPK